MVKAGFKTSEFIVALIGVNIPVLNQQLGWNIPTESVVAITTIVIAYITSRTVAKRNGSNPVESDKPK